MKKLIGSLFTIAALTLVASGAFAKDPVGNEVLPFEFDNPPVYIDCVGEIVNGHVVGESRYHEFTTPSGTFHVVDQWRFKVYQTGTISGRVWVGYGVSPFQMNTRVEKGQVQQWVSNIRFVDPSTNRRRHISTRTNSRSRSMPTASSWFLMRRTPQATATGASVRRNRFGRSRVT